jgi:hypothetical protein
MLQENKLVRSFNITFRYIDDILSLNNFTVGDFVDRIYPTRIPHIQPDLLHTLTYTSTLKMRAGDRKTFEVMTST